VRFCRSALFVVFLGFMCVPMFGETWYVRGDGGTRYSAKVHQGQCDGKADAHRSFFSTALMGLVDNANSAAGKRRCPLVIALITTVAALASIPLEEASLPGSRPSRVPERWTSPAPVAAARACSRQPPS